MFTMKKKNAMSTGGITADRSLGTARRARPAMVTVSWKKPVGRGRTGVRSMVGGMSMVVIGGPPWLRRIGLVGVGVGSTSGSTGVASVGRRRTGARRC